MARGEILYGTRLLPGPAIHDRVARTTQSDAASALAEVLRAAAPAPGINSKSHSRALVAAAVASAEVQALGIDVEWMAPGRPFAAIMRSFAPSLPAAIDGEAFYRAWTFLEAYYKAFQRWPDENDIKQVLNKGASEGPWQIATGTQLLQRQVAGSFQLTLVWKCSGLCTIREAPDASVI